MLSYKNIPQEITTPGKDRTDWNYAQQRVLRYLNSLNMDPVQALAVARLVLEIASENLGPNATPVADAMRALRIILFSRPSVTKAAMQQVLVREKLWPEEKITATPALNRGKMIPENIERPGLKILRLLRRKRQPAG